MSKLLQRGDARHAHALHTWIARRISVRQRLQRVCGRYLLFLMVVRRKHALEEAARFSGRNTSLFSKVWKYQAHIAIYTLQDLSKTPARQFSTTLQSLKGLPWKMAILLDSTLQQRASLPPENAKPCNHGNGSVIGPQWTTIVLLVNDMLMPLPPIPYYSQRYCLEHARD